MKKGEATPLTEREMEELTDENLYLRVASGESNAFPTLYRRHNRPLYGFVTKMLGSDDQAAEDMYQVIWSEIIKSAPQFRVDGKFRAWMYQIARNRINMLFRTRYSKKESLLNAPTEEDDSAPVSMDQFASQESSIEDQLIAHARNERLEQAIARLPDRQRQMLVFWLSEELSYREIADNFSVTETVVKTTLFRARQKLLEMLQAEDEERLENPLHPSQRSTR